MHKQFKTSLLFGVHTVNVKPSRSVWNQYLRFFFNNFFLSELAGTVASYLTLRDTLTKPKSKQNNSSSTYHSQALERSYGKNLNVFTTCRHRQQLQRPPAWFTSHSQSRRMLPGHLANSWQRYSIVCQAGFINCVLRPSILARMILFHFGSRGSFASALTETRPWQPFQETVIFVQNKKLVIILMEWRHGES